MRLNKILQSNECDCIIEDSRCAKAITKYLKNKKKRKKKTKHTKPAAKIIYAPKPPATAQGESTKFPYFTAFAERQHFVNLMEDLRKNQISKFREMYEAPNVRNPRGAGRPRGSKNKPTVRLDDIPMAGAAEDPQEDDKSRLRHRPFSEAVTDGEL